MGAGDDEFDVGDVVGDVLLGDVHEKKKAFSSFASRLAGDKTHLILI